MWPTNIVIIMYNYTMKTQITQKEWHQIAAELRAKMNECGLNPKSLSINAGINYDAAYRLIKGGLKRRSKAAFQLCDYFKIDMTNNTISTTDKMRLDISREIDTVWDGSEAHARLLQKLIRSTKEFAIHNKSGRSL